jgi:hypothetical protein
MGRVPPTTSTSIEFHTLDDIEDDNMKVPLTPIKIPTRRLSNPPSPFFLRRDANSPLQDEIRRSTSKRRLTTFHHNHPNIVVPYQLPSTPSSTSKSTKSLSIRSIASSNSPLRRFTRRATITAIKQQFVIPEHSETDDTFDDIDDDLETELNMFPFKMDEIELPIAHGLSIIEDSKNERIENVTHLDQRILLYLMSFMPLDDLVRFSASCIRTYSICSQCDILWSRELLRNGFYKIVYDALPEPISPATPSKLSKYFDDSTSMNLTTVRERFLEYVKDRDDRSQRKKKIVSRFQYWHRGQVILQCGYGFISPILFAFGLILTAFFMPLYLDDYIIRTKLNLFYCFIPFIAISVPSYLFLLCGVLCDPFIVNRFKQKYYISMLEDGHLGPQETIHQYDYIQHESDRANVTTINLLVWTVASIPLLILSFIIQHLIWPDTLLYSAVPLPQYVLTICLVFGPVLSHLICSPNGTRDIIENRVEDIPAKQLYYVQIIYFVCVVISFLISLQAGLICAKLDGLLLTKTKWMVILVPSLTVLVLCTVTAAMSYFLSLLLKSEGLDNCTKNTTVCASVLLAIIILPALFSILFIGLKIDGILGNFSFTYMMIPVICTCLSFVATTIVCSCGCFAFKIIRYTENEE